MNHHEPAMNLPFPTGRTVLLIEDRSCLFNVLATVLRRCGYWVVGATSFAEAERFAHDLDSIDLLLGPIESPEMSREHLAEWFSSVHPKTPVLWTSNRAAELGAGDSVVEKPYIYIDAFIRKVRAVLNPAAQTAALAA